MRRTLGQIRALLSATSTATLPLRAASQVSGRVRTGLYAAGFFRIVRQWARDRFIRTG